MTTPNNNEQNQDDSAESSNIDLIYTYTESLLKTQVDSISKLDTRLATFLAFSGVLLKLVFDLPLAAANNSTSHLQQIICQSSTSLKVIACLFPMLAILLTASALTFQPKFFVAAPKDLMRADWYWAEKEETQKFIVRQWLETIKEIKQTARYKGTKLNFSIWLLGIGGVTYGLDVIVLNICK